MKKFNITVQVYSQFDPNKQIQISTYQIKGYSKDDAIGNLKESLYETQYTLIKIIRIEEMNTKLFNITAQVYKNNDTSKQTILFNQIIDGTSQDDAIENFKLHFPSIEYSLVKVYSAEETDESVCSNIM